MNRLGAVALAAAAIVAVALPFFLKPFGIYLISMWAVLTIAAIGLNLTLGYAGQVSMAQGAFVGIGAYAVALLTQAGFPLTRIDTTSEKEAVVQQFSGDGGGAIFTSPGAIWLSNQKAGTTWRIDPKLVIATIPE